MTRRTSKRVSTAGIAQTRANSPGQAASVIHDDPEATDYQCSHHERWERDGRGKLKGINRCARRASIFRKWQWWCRVHDPGNVPGVGCHHDMLSPCHGVLTCSFCGFQPEQETP